MGDFYDRKTLKEFYQIDCDLDIHPNYNYQGKIREEFRAILEIQHPHVQARILRGVLKRFSPYQNDAPHTRTKELRKKLINIHNRLASHTDMVHFVTPDNSSDAVRRALADAQNLIRTGGTPHAVDRIHTALHGYFKNLCDQENIQYDADASITKLFKRLRKDHPAFHDYGPKKSEIQKVLNSIANIVDALNPIRNEASSAHPTDSLLSDAEATLAINAGLSILQYTEHKLKIYSRINEIPF